MTFLFHPTFNYHFIQSLFFVMQEIHLVIFSFFKNKCGNKTVHENFSVITENVPCGTTGTTCSKTVRVQLGVRKIVILFLNKSRNVAIAQTADFTVTIIQISLKLQRNEIKLVKGNYTENDLVHGPDVPYRIRRVGLYLVIESTIGLAVMWDRKTTVRVLLEPQHSVSHSNRSRNDHRSQFVTTVLIWFICSSLILF